MTPTSIGANVHQALDVHALQAPQVSLYLIITFDGIPKLGYVSIGQVLNSSIWINASLS